MRVISVVMAVATLGVLSTGAYVQAQTYRFDIIAQTIGGFDEFLFPSINNRSEVVFLESHPGGQGAIYAGSVGALRVVARTGASAPGTNDQIVVLTNPPSINESGEVAFVAELAGGTFAIYVRSGDKTVVVVPPANKPLRWPVINGSGTVTFWVGNPSDVVIEAIHKWHRGRITPIFEIPDGDPLPSGITAIDEAHDQNAAGTVVIVGGDGSPETSTYYLIPRDGEASRILDGTSQCSPSLNNAGKVGVAPGGFCSSLNDLGEIAYSNGTDILVAAPGGTVRKVTGLREPLFGSTVLSLGSAPLAAHSMNNAGAIAFTAQLADGRKVLAVATPQ